MVEGADRARAVLPLDSVRKMVENAGAGTAPAITTVIVGVLMKLLQQLWREDKGQDIAEYAVMLAVILVIVVGTVRLIGSNANNTFSSVASSIQ